MKTDKLFYRIFLNQPSLISELLQGIPPDCEFDYSAPVVKEKEIRLDGLLTPISTDVSLPLVFLEAQMQTDTEFYGRYFGGIFVYLHQYKIARSWQGLLILRSRSLDLGSEIPYQSLLSSSVTRLYLEDLLSRENLSPNLSLLKLVVMPETEAAVVAKSILNRAQNQVEFEKYLDLVEAILVNKFSNLSIEEIRNMLDLREADVTKTRFYQEVIQIGRQEGRQEGEQLGQQLGEANLIVRQISRRFGALTPEKVSQIRSLSIPQLESLGEALLDFQSLGELDSWLQENSL
ncbi:MAG: Rpn family recombination-promoting nuclease/putative transposase [Oscillatoriaceae cyanobacterium]